MKLLYAQGACSLSTHICLEELGIPYEAQMVSIQKKGPELLKFNAFGYVPVLVLDSGEAMTEAIALLQYLAVTYGNKKKLIPDAGTKEWRSCLRWLSFTSSELHKTAGVLFHKESLTPEYIKEVQNRVESRMGYMDSHLTNDKFLVGEEFSIADMYALAILRICHHVGFKLEKYSALKRYTDMLEIIPSISKVLSRENKESAKKTA